MAWVRLDDSIFENPKVANLSKDAKLLYLAGLTYCAKYLTDGRLTPAGIRLTQAVADVNGASVEELLSARLWKLEGADIQVHDWADYNPPASRVREERQAAKERMRKLRSGERSAEQVPNVQAPRSRPRTRISLPEPTPSTPRESAQVRVESLLQDAVFIEELRVRFSSLDLAYECEKWKDHVTTKPPKGNYKNSLRNWMANALKYQGERGGEPRQQAQIDWLHERFEEGQRRRAKAS